MNPQKATPIVSVRNLCKDFRRPGGGLFTVLEGINLDIYEHEFVAIVGISGSGKTTLLRVMAGLIPPDRGSVSFMAADTKNPIGFVFQNFALFPWLTVKENISLSVLQLPYGERNARVERIIETLGLSGFVDCHPAELSGGTKQRVSLGRALVSNPLALFLDEPFSNLDPLTCESLRSEILRQWLKEDAKVKCIVFVTHSFEEAIQMADRVIVLSSSPGTIYKTIPVDLTRPRKINSPEFQSILTDLENSFGELHLDRITQETPENTLILSPQGSFESAPASISPHTEPQSFASDAAVSEDTQIVARRARPLINCPLTFVEGLVLRLIQESQDIDLYELCEEMNQSVKQMLPAVAAAEMLGFVVTPGTLVHITPIGRAFAEEDDPAQRQKIISSACLSLPFFRTIYTLVELAGEDGFTKDEILAQIALILPFEDPDLQFDALLKWGRHCDLFTYDISSETLFVEE